MMSFLADWPKISAGLQLSPALRLRRALVSSISFLALASLVAAAPTAVTGVGSCSVTTEFSESTPPLVEGCSATGLNSPFATDSAAELIRGESAFSFQGHLTAAVSNANSTNYAAIAKSTVDFAALWSVRTWGPVRPGYMLISVNIGSFKTSNRFEVKSTVFGPGFKAECSDFDLYLPDPAPCSTYPSLWPATGTTASAFYVLPAILGQQLDFGYSASAIDLDRHDDAFPASDAFASLYVGFFEEDAITAAPLLPDRASVPEPATWMMAGIGFVGMSIRRVIER